MVYWSRHCGPGSQECLDAQGNETAPVMPSKVRWLCAGTPGDDERAKAEVGAILVYGMVVQSLSLSVLYTCAHKLLQ